MNSPYISSCPVGCNAPLQTTSIVLPEGALLRCTSCGQWVSQCNEVRYVLSMQEFDDPQGTLPSAGSTARRFKLGGKWLGKIGQMLAKPAQEIQLLDVGCSSGVFLRIATQLGYQAEGVEPATRAAQAAQAAGLKVHHGLLQDIGFAAGSFDAVTLFEVIEHLKEPLSLLKECRRILKPGGVMLIGTGNAASWTAAAMGSRWEYLHIDGHGGHVSFFNPASMALLAQRSGFALEKIETRNVRFFEKGERPPAIYAAAKIAAELLNAPARLLGKGHDMAAFLRRPI